MNTFFSKSTKDAAISPISDNLSTVTPNTPTNPNILMKEVGTQTIIDGVNVGKMVETIDILQDVLTKTEAEELKRGINIFNITD
jgi:hypothetical protein